MVKTQVCVNEIAKANKMSEGDDLCNPDNPKGINKEFPRSLAWGNMAEMGALGNGLLHGSVGTLKGVSRKKVIDYDPKKSIKQLAELNGVTIPTIRKFIIEKNIDRNRDEKLNTYNKIWFEYIKDSDVSTASLAKKLKMSVNTIKEYLGKDAKEIAVGEGKIGMASEHPLVKELREDISNLKKRFDKFCMIREQYENLSAGEYLKRLGWSDDKEGRNLALVVNFMNMREFMYKFKDKGIEFIHN